MNVNLYVIEDYGNETTLRPKKTNPIQTQSNPISEKPKMNVNLYVIEDYGNETTLRPKKTNPKQTQNKPNQSQGIGNELKSPISPKLTTCPIYQRSYLYYATADLINAGTVTLTRLWNLRIFHSIISHRNTSLTSD
jgi:hypothetical protein